MLDSVLSSEWAVVLSVTKTIQVKTNEFASITDVKDTISVHDRS